MLFDLKVLNGEMTPKFDKYNNTYSVTVEENITELMLEYKANPDYYVKVVGNDNLMPGDNIVYIEVMDEDNVSTYTLYVYKEYTETVFSVKEIIEEPVNKELPEYVAPLIAGICLFIILLFSCILFRRKKSAK